MCWINKKTHGVKSVLYLRGNLMFMKEVKLLKQRAETLGSCFWVGSVRFLSIRLFGPQKTRRSTRGSKCSATRSTAASARCRDASRTERGAPRCRTPTCWPWGASRFCPTPGSCTAGTRSTTRRWRAAPASPGSSVSLSCFS